ncbi:MAG: hypothetical protein F9B45_30955 [Phycisphaera sp. RhM]|nr:hypothetical protein [Phycisphaera sp. RhM]
MMIASCKASRVPKWIAAAAMRPILISSGRYRNGITSIESARADCTVATNRHDVPSASQSGKETAIAGKIFSSPNRLRWCSGDGQRCKAFIGGRWERDTGVQTNGETANAGATVAVK